MLCWVHIAVFSSFAKVHGWLSNLYINLLAWIKISAKLVPKHYQLIILCTHEKILFS